MSSNPFGDTVLGNLLYFGRHLDKCPVCNDSMYKSKPVCNCGFQEAIDAARTASTRQPDETPTPNWLLASARALLDLDAQNALAPHGIGGHARDIIQQFINVHRHVERLYNERPSEREASVLAMEALRRLVALKDHKDKIGKDAYYEFEQPIAWRMAKKALADEQGRRG